jgi:hypothetical protein
MGNFKIKVIALLVVVAGILSNQALAESITISIIKDRFILIDGLRMGTVYSRSPNGQQFLSQVRPISIRKEPPYTGVIQKYGELKLGDTVFYYVFDMVNDLHPVLYVDRNADGDLTNDKGPVPFGGSPKAAFAAMIHLPLNIVLPKLDRSGHFDVWLFSHGNYSSLDIESISHYCRTVLQGYVSIDGKTHKAYIVDSGINDADYTSDSTIQIDLDDSGRIDHETEMFPTNEQVLVAGKSREFDITW